MIDHKLQSSGALLKHLEDLGPRQKRLDLRVEDGSVVPLNNLSTYSTIYEPVFWRESKNAKIVFLALVPSL